MLISKQCQTYSLPVYIPHGMLTQSDDVFAEKYCIIFEIYEEVQLPYSISIKDISITIVDSGAIVRVITMHR